MYFNRAPFDAFYKLLLLLLAGAEIVDCLLLAPSLTPARAACLLLALPVYLLVFHVCMDEEFRARLFSRLQQTGWFR